MFSPGSFGSVSKPCTPVVHIKIAGIYGVNRPPKNGIFIGIDPYPIGQSCFNPAFYQLWPLAKRISFPLEWWPAFSVVQKPGCDGFNPSEKYESQLVIMTLPHIYHGKSTSIFIMVPNHQPVYIYTINLHHKWVWHGNQTLLKPPTRYTSQVETSHDFAGGTPMSSVDVVRSPGLPPWCRPDVSSLSAERAATLAPLCSKIRLCWNMRPGMTGWLQVALEGTKVAKYVRPLPSWLNYA